MNSKRRKNRNEQGITPRKVNQREERQRFLIVCEGAKTEPNYFKKFNGRMPSTTVHLLVEELIKSSS